MQVQGNWERGLKREKPPTSNRGVTTSKLSRKKGISKMRISKSLDWIAATQPATDISEFNNIIPEGFEQTERLKPSKWYPNRWKLSPAGTYALCASGTISQMIEFTGSDLRAVRENGMSDIQVLKHCQSECKQFTRLDYAVDILDSTVEALDFLELWHRGYFTTRTRTVKHFTTEQDLPESTVYFGSEKSEAMLRIYDKGSQMRLLNTAWLRVEMQVRKKKADLLARDMVQLGLTTAGDQILKDTYACNAIPALRDALSDVEVDLTPLPRKQTNWRKWMDGQVFDSMVKHAADDEDREFLSDWLKRVINATMK